MTLAQPSEHIHHRFMPQTLTRGKHTHYLQNTSIRDTSHHTLGNRHIGDTCQILLQEDHFVTPSGTHTSEILYILSSTRNTYSLPTQQTHQRYIMAYTPQTGSLRHRLANTYTRDTMHLLLYGDTATTFTTVFGKQTSSHTREQHQTYAPPYTLTQREHRHTRET